MYGKPYKKHNPGLAHLVEHLTVVVSKIIHTYFGVFSYQMVAGSIPAIRNNICNMFSIM